MFASFLGERGTAQHHLDGQGSGVDVRHAELHGAVNERLDEDKDVRGAAGAECGCDVDEFFVVEVDLLAE